MIAAVPYMYSTCTGTVILKSGSYIYWYRYCAEHITFTGTSLQISEATRQSATTGTHARTHMHARTHTHPNIYSTLARQIANDTHTLSRTHADTEKKQSNTSTCAHSFTFASLDRVHHAPYQHTTAFLQWCVRKYTYPNRPCP